MPLLSPRGVGFQSINQLLRRLNADPSVEPMEAISLSDDLVPSWQRQLVWNDDEMGLLALSIVRNYPIGMIILWKKPGGLRVPIDGRQRLTAIKYFAEGRISIPNIPLVPAELRNRKYRLLPGDVDAGLMELGMQEKDAFDDYNMHMVQYDEIPESIAMDIFVMLQGGKALTKTEVRAALGGALCDFVTDLTSHGTDRHSFFRDLSANVANRRKAHRSICDVLLHEYLFPGQDKHWTSLEQMYRDKARTLSDNERAGFRRELTAFRRACETVTDGQRHLMPQLRSTYFIVSVFKVWRDLNLNYDLPTAASFAEGIAAFETERQATPDDMPWVNFTSALSNAGYAQNRLQQRHDILMGFLLRRFPDAVLKQRDRRTFTLEQKIAIWERAGRRCEWELDGARCEETFVHPREADADHVVLWSANGPTTVANGRLLCQAHNRARQG